ESASLFIGDADLLRALHAQDGIGALEAGKIVGIGPGSVEGGVARLTLPQVDGSEPKPVQVPAVAAGPIAYGDHDRLPGYVISEQAARTIGLIHGAVQISPSYPTLVTAPGPLTNEQIREVKDIASGYPGMFVASLGDFLPQFGSARAAATAGAALIALCIVAVTVALVASESRRDQAIMVAVGAPPRTRRRIAGARAGLIALLAAIIAVPAGFFSVAVVQFSRSDVVIVSRCARCSAHFPIVVPVTAIVVALIAVPVLATAWGWLTSRHPQRNALLQPLA
ncbi:MAG: FtsX-like permease family protein, partial [Steroidobacteraceae bacterium]